MEEMKKYEVTQADLDGNPSLAEAGIEVGSVIEIPASNEAGDLTGWVIAEETNEDDSDEDEASDEDTAPEAPEAPAE